MTNDTHATTSEENLLTVSSSVDNEASKWKPYWDENYKRYYWSDGNDSIWNIPKGCCEPPPPNLEPSLISTDEQQQYIVNNYNFSLGHDHIRSDVRFQPYIVPPVISNTMNVGKRLVGQDARDIRQLNHYFDYNAWNEELNRTDGNQKKKVKLTKKELDAIKARRAEIKRKHRNRWLLED